MMGSTDAHCNKIINVLSFYGFIGIVSFLTFGFIIKPVYTNLFLALEASILLLIFLVILYEKNYSALSNLLFCGVAVTVGYGVAKLYQGVPFDGIWKNGWGPIIYTYIRMIIIAIILIEYLILLSVIYKGKQNIINGSSGSNKDDIIILYPERENDLERLELYISDYPAVGVNGIWGSGKTVLVDEFYNRHRSEYHLIKVEPLVCNLDQIELYLFQRLEEVLWQERIYPRYSRKICDVISANAWTNKIFNFSVIINTDNTAAFEGFCEDLDKLSKPVLLIYEDIDRISENNKNQISKMLDISSKLQHHNVKVIYEYDIYKMTELGYGHEYIEKYVPYVVNISEISLKHLIDLSLDRTISWNGGLCADDFSFLFQHQHLDSYLKKVFNLDFSLEIKVKGATPRRVQIFVDEVNTALSNSEMANKEYRRTVIAYYFIKHFFNKLYEEINFEENLIESIKFQMVPYNGHSYSMMELVNKVKIGEHRTTIVPSKKYDENKDIEEQIEEIHEFGFTLDAISRMFGIDNTIKLTEKTNEEQIVESNKNKLGLLQLLGYKFQYANDERVLEENMQREINNKSINPRKDNNRINQNPLLNPDEEIFRNINYNDKIGRIIKNLYYSSYSEYTNQEAVAKDFIENVINTPENKWKENWKALLDRAFHHKIYKDNGTVFRIGEDSFVSIFRALNVYLAKNSEIDEAGLTDNNNPDNDIELDEGEDEIITKALEFYKRTGNNPGKLDLDKVVILNLCRFKGKDFFIKAITYFNSLKITGNFNQDKVFFNFLKKYYGFAFTWGYLSDFELYRLESPRDVINDKFFNFYDDSLIYVKEYLDECVKCVNKTFKSIEDGTKVKKELEKVLTFMKKCRKIMDEEKQAAMTEMKIRTSMRTVTNYKNENVYNNLMEKIENSESKLDDIMNEIIEQYDKGNLTFREFDFLKNKLFERKDG